MEMSPSRNDKLVLAVLLVVLCPVGTRLGGALMVILKDAQIIDMCTGPVPRRGSIVTEDGRIVAVEYGDVVTPDGACDVFLDGRYVLPGLIDCHTHLCMTATLFELKNGMGGLDDTTASFFALENARRALTSGVTSVRDLGGQNYIEIRLKEFIDAGHVAGPRIFSAGKMITTTGGHGWVLGEEADSPEEVLKAVKKQVKAGAYLVKMMVSGGVMTRSSQPHFLQYDCRVLEKAAQLAHELDRVITGHVGNPRALRAAIESGFDCVEHALPEDEEALKSMLERGMFCIPTMLTYPLWASSLERWDAPEYFLAKKRKQNPDAKRAFLRRAHQKGLKVAAGTDAGCPYVPFGCVADEVQILSECGFSNFEAISAATRVASELLGEERVGAIKKGGWADLIVLDDNPLDDILALKSPRMVVKAGQIVFQRETTSCSI